MTTSKSKKTHTTNCACGTTHQQQQAPTRPKQNQTEGFHGKHSETRGKSHIRSKRFLKTLGWGWPILGKKRLIAKKYVPAELSADINPCIWMKRTYCGILAILKYYNCTEKEYSNGCSPFPSYSDYGSLVTRGILCFDNEAHTCIV